MAKEIKKIEAFDVDDAVIGLAASVYVTISHLNDLYASVHPAIVWNENDAVREALRISSEIEFIKNKLIDIKALGHKIDEYYAENE